MSKILVLLVGIAMTWGLVASFGLISLAVCFAFALATLIFSTRADESEGVISTTGRGGKYAAASKTYLGGL
jgi:hypothetical protein